MKTKAQTGFTLYELLTTMLIVGIVLSLGIPNMQSFRQNSRMTAAANDLHSSFHLARSEAARSKMNITICASADPFAATPVCSGELEAGWVVFEDRDGDIAVNGFDSVLKRFPPVHTSIDIKTRETGPDDYFSFASTGLGRGNVEGKGIALATMMLCDGRGNVRGGGGKSTARVLVVTPLGRATVLADESQIKHHGGCLK